MKYWLRYSKSGLMRFVGHLDMLQTWERILRRAGIPLTFSQGFSPRPLLSLAAPLPVGMSSYAEYLELETREEVPALTKMVTPALPQGMEVLGAVRVPTDVKALMGLIRYADYKVEDLGPEQWTCLEQQLSSFLDKEVVLQEVKRKGGASTINIRPLVASARLEDGALQLRLATGSTANLRVEDFLNQFSLAHANLTISRRELYLEKEGQLFTPFEYITCSYSR